MAKILPMAFLCFWVSTGLVFSQNLPGNSRSLRREPLSPQRCSRGQGDTSWRLHLPLREREVRLLYPRIWSVILNGGIGSRFQKDGKPKRGRRVRFLGHDTIAGLIWVFPHSASSLQEVQRQMQEGLVEDDVQLRLAGPLQSSGKNAVTGIYSGTFQRQPVKARGIGTFLPNGGGAYIVAMTVPNKFGSELENAADAVAKSMQPLKAQESATAGGTGGAGTSSGSGNQQLMQQMAGSYYSFTSAGPYSSGGTERRVTLCPNGTYYSGSESGYSGGAGTGDAWGSAGRQSGRGTWRVQGNVNQGTLTTIDSSGKATEYRYQRCGGDCIYIGNTKFAVAGPANCP